MALLVGVAGIALAGCGQKHEAVRRCVDENGNFVDGAKCSGSPADGHKYQWVYAPAGQAKSD